MDDALGYFILAIGGFVVVVGIIVFVCWVVLATLLRVFAWIVFYWCFAFGAAAVAGLVTGLVVPLRVLSGRSRTKPEIATPDGVVAQRVITHPPRGFAKHFGWDRAWPEYNPYQARRDAAAVHAETKLLLSRLWKAVGGSAGKHDPSAPDEEEKKDLGLALSALMAVPRIVWAVCVPIPYAGFALALYASFIIWFLTMLVIGGAVYLCQQAWTLGYRWWDRGRMFRVRAVVKCPHCYETNPRPSYRCPNPGCAIVHHDVSPGPLGVVKRRCACETSFPTTVGAASKVLVALCPSCGEALVEGSGARRTVQLPAFGSVGAGKTRFFAAALTAAGRQLASSNGSLEGLNAEAEGFLRASARAVDAGTATEKTIHTMRPEGRPVKLTDASGKVLELQVMDAAGESFTSLQATEELTYVNSARTMVFVLDPLALPRVRAEMGAAHGLPDVLVAAGDQEEAYASVVDRIRSEAVDLAKRHRAVVLTKTDVLRRLPSGRSLDPETSEGVRDWLVGVEQDGFVRRIESDFRDVRFFAIDSLVLREPHDPLNPLRVIDWALSSQKIPIALVPPPDPGPDAADADREKANTR